MKTAEGNKLIAEFMGYKFFKSAFGGWGLCRDEKDMSTWLEVKEAKYHSSWDWLMPVWVKFRKLELDDDVYLKDILDLSYDLWLCDTPEDFFKKLVPAIEWYNKEQSVKESDTSKAT